MSIRPEFFACGLAAILLAGFLGELAAHLPANAKPLVLLPVLLAYAVVWGTFELLNRWQIDWAKTPIRWQLFSLGLVGLTLAIWTAESARGLLAERRLSPKMQMAAQMLSMAPDSSIAAAEIAPRWSDWFNHRVKNFAPGFGVPFWIGELTLALVVALLAARRQTQRNSADAIVTAASADSATSGGTA